MLAHVVVAQRLVIGPDTKASSVAREQNPLGLLAASARQSRANPPEATQIGVHLSIKPASQAQVEGFRELWWQRQA